MEICQNPVRSGGMPRRQFAKLRAKAVDVMHGKRARIGEAYLAPQAVPLLREIVQAGLAQQAADAGQDAGVVFEH